MHILEQLYAGNIRPCEQGIRKGGEVREIYHKIVLAEDKLLPLLSKEQRAQYENIMEMKNEANGILECEKFIYGFRLGVQIVAEAMGKIKKEI